MNINVEIKKNPVPIESAVGHILAVWATPNKASDSLRLSFRG